MGDFKLTPIGTCRISNPVKRACVTYPFKSNFTGIYGFVHTSGEALQQILYVLGCLDIPECLQPYIFRPSEVGKITKKVYELSDCYIVEISSAKKITVDSFHLQINYLYRQFPDFFSDSKRVRTFWSLAAKGIEEDIDLFLESLPAFHDMTQNEQRIIRSIRLTQMGDAEIANDMARIVDLLGGERVIFMTHVDARMPDGDHIKARSKLINTVEKIAAELGIPCVNPTTVMENYGQSFSLEKGGLDLTHYTDVFGDILFNSIFQEQIIPRLSGNDFSASEMQAKVRAIAEKTAAMLFKNDLVSAGALLFESMREYPSEVSLIQLRAEIFCRIGYFEKALEDALHVESEIGPADAISRVKLRALIGLGRWQDVLTTVELMLADEIENENVLLAAAEASEALEMWEKAVQFWGRLTLTEPDNSFGWARYLSCLGLLGRHREFDKAFDSVAERFPEDVYFLKTVITQAMVFGSEQVFMRTLHDLLEVRPLEAISVVKELQSVPLIDLAASCIKNLPQQIQLSWEFKEKVHSIAGLWISRAKILEQEHTLSSLSAAFVYANASRKIYLAKDVTTLCRQIRLGWREKIKTLYQSGEYQQIVVGAVITDSLFVEEPASAIFYIRSLIQLKSYDTACLLVNRILDNNASLRVLHGLALRCALNASDFSIAADTTVLLLRLQEFLELDNLDLLEKLRKSVSSKLLKVVRLRVGEQQLDDAWYLLNKLAHIETDAAKVDRERKLIAREFRERLIRANEDDTAPMNRLDAALALLAIDPDNTYALKCAAVGTMQLQQYERALDFWRHLESISGSSESVASQIAKCTRFVEKAVPRPKIELN